MGSGGGEFKENANTCLLPFEEWEKVGEARMRESHKLSSLHRRALTRPLGTLSHARCTGEGNKL